MKNSRSETERDPDLDATVSDHDVSSACETRAVVLDIEGHGRGEFKTRTRGRAHSLRPGGAMTTTTSALASSAARHEQRYARSADLFRRAREIIPGGIHLSGRPLVDPETSPMYLERAKGCRVWDVDGTEYVDLFMAFGPFLIGYADERVDAAAESQARRGRLLSMNHPMHVRFTDALLSRFDAEMGVFFRTGSEATTAALRIARRATGRRAVARCGYHGWHDWCLPLEDYVPAGLDREVPEFCASDPESLRALLAARRNEFAAVIVAPEMVLPHDPKIFHELLRMTHEHGALFVMDEVKTGLRIDLMTVSKALGNGWPVAAVLGKRDVMQAGAGMHYSGTFHGDTSAMAAALETIRIADESGAAAYVEELGELLIDGLNSLARTHSIAALAYGEPLPAMPFLRFEDPVIATAFYRSMFRGGVLMHPRHMWFISLAHKPLDIAFVLDVADRAMKQAISIGAGAGEF
jgi:glutamate-1-semialdehyde aminotransferase